MIRDLGLILEGELRNDYATGALAIGDCSHLLALIASRFPPRSHWGDQPGTRVRITIEPLAPQQDAAETGPGPLLIPPL